MAVLHDLEVAVVVVPAAVAGVFLGLDMVAPVHLDERHPMLDQPPAEQARLAKARQAIAFLDLLWFAREIERSRRLRRGEHSQRLAAVVIEDTSRSQRIAGSFEPGHRIEEL